VGLRAAARQPASGRWKASCRWPCARRCPRWTPTWPAWCACTARHPAEDGSERLLLALADGQTVEAVLLPGRTPGLCVSSQVGCAVGCQFCMTGVGGLLRQLGSAEIVAQVALARALRPVHKVVFMGMGEPAHNLDNVLEAIQLLGTVGQIGHKNLVFSTVGDPRAFTALMALTKGQVRPALALSLHTTDAALRERLLPRAPRLTPAELVDQADAYARTTGYPVQYQWTLLDGVNDSDDELAGIERLLAGRFGVLNLIPWNRVDGMPFQRPSWERAAAMARHLHRRGILTKLRHSAGQDAMTQLSPLVSSFVGHFGEMGSRWGINRTVGQIYALVFRLAGAGACRRHRREAGVQPQQRQHGPEGTAGLAAAEAAPLSGRPARVLRGAGRRLGDLPAPWPPSAAGARSSPRCRCCAMPAGTPPATKPTASPRSACATCTT
jgi:23S rRNA (adenine2503-C2)-methyltransferase